MLSPQYTYLCSRQQPITTTTLNPTPVRAVVDVPYQDLCNYYTP